MPWPAKPPMTLKEAKRASKLDGAGFKFTASQLARADRQDVQEEKRRTALEKDKKRAENKRKRDLKCEKDRAVKRQMFEEGRISVEDTWGKVTASQPRLNKFFARPAGEGSRPARLGCVPAQLSDGDASDDLSYDQPAKDSRERSCDPSLSQAAATSKEYATSLTSGTAWLAMPLREINPSQLNAVRGPAQKDPKHREQEEGPGQIATTEPRHLATATLLHQVSVFNCPASDKAFSPPVNCGQNQIIPLPANRTLSAIPVPSHSSTTRPLAENSVCKETDLNVVTEEDFADGIDEKDLLEIFDPQSKQSNEKECAAKLQQLSEPNPLGCASSNNHSISPPCIRPPGSPADTECQSPSPLETHTSKDIAPPVINESFSAVFNEFDESDLVAFAEQVEAEMHASRMTVATSSTAMANDQPEKRQTLRKPAISGLMPAIRQEISLAPSKRAEKAMSHPSPANAEGSVSTLVGSPTKLSIPSTARKRIRDEATFSGIVTAEPEMRPPRRRIRRPRVMPWDEIEAPGPSTQAMMLELLERAEAQIKTKK